MKLNIVLVLFFGINFTFVIGDDCGSHIISGKWICTKNERSKLKVTYDCGLNNEKDTVIWIWDSSMADEIDELIIQNCETATLHTRLPSVAELKELGSYKRIDLKNNFHNLHVINASQILVQNIIPGNWKTRAKSTRYYNSYESYTRSCSLKNIIFENVSKATFEDFFHGCLVNGKLKSLKLINFGIKELKLSNLKLEELIMKNVTVDKAEPNVFKIDGSSNIEITDSNLKKVNTDFLVGKTNEVIIANTNFNKLYSKTFKLEANKITLNNNSWDYLPDDCLSFTSNNIQITNNVFRHVDGNAFNRSESYKINNSYNFSNNVIYSLLEGALNIAQHINGKGFFDNFTIAENKINCDCENMYWFDSINKMKNDFNQSRFYYKLVQKSSQNKCLNFPKCL